MVEIDILEKLKAKNPLPDPGPEMDEKSTSSPALLKDYHQLRCICSHPLLLKHDEEMNEDSHNEESDNECGSENATQPERMEPKLNWWKPYCPEEKIQNIECSAKLVVLLSIIAECELIGEKVLVFSQSLIMLDLIEKYLRMIHENTLNPELNQVIIGGFKGRWEKEVDGKKRSTISDWMARLK